MKQLIVFLQFVFVTGAILFGLHGMMTSRGEPQALAFTATDGTLIDLDKMRGKVVLLDFWATWCGPCREEVPNVVAAFQRFHDQGLEVVGVSLDQDLDAMTQFTAANNMTWPQNFDGQGWGNGLARHFGVRSIPAMYLFDKKGRLVTRDAREDLQGQIAVLLREP
jgi:thiol-disulfide isomerase/thioredoxin